jgi:hypothetical protein
MAAETETTGTSGFTPRQVRVLKISVIIMGALIVLCVFALIGGIYYQANRVGKDGGDRSRAAAGAGPAARGAPLILKVKPGAVVDSMASEGGLLILRLKSPGGDEISVVDPKSGEEIRRIVLRAE